MGTSEQFVMKTWNRIQKIKPGLLTNKDSRYIPTTALLNRGEIPAHAFGTCHSRANPRDTKAMARDKSHRSWEYIHQKAFSNHFVNKPAPRFAPNEPGFK